MAAKDLKTASERLTSQERARELQLEFCSHITVPTRRPKALCTECLTAALEAHAAEAVDVLAEALRIKTCECERLGEVLPLADHGVECPYRVAMERAGLA